MAKKRINEFFKAMAITSLSIGLFCAAFIGINNLVFAAATNGPQTVPPIAVSVNVPNLSENVPPEGFQEPKLTVFVLENGNDPTTNRFVLSPDEAAMIGAQYIWEVFGESIDGKAVEMSYLVWPSHSRTYWMGRVADSRQHLENWYESFRFTIDAVTGERIGIGQNATVAFGENDLTLTHSDLSMSRDLRFDLMLEPYQLEKFTQIAGDFAAKHFSNSNVVSVEFFRANQARFGRDNTGNMIVTEFALNFYAVDDTDREAELTISVNRQQLWRIDTQHNDIVPGFHYRYILLDNPDGTPQVAEPCPEWLAGEGEPFLEIYGSPERQALWIECDERNISFLVQPRDFATLDGNTELSYLGVDLNDVTTFPIYARITFTEAALIGASAIYEKFDICINGLVGYMYLMSTPFVGNAWVGWIIDEERTRYVRGSELFHFQVDLVTGEINVLVMNTPKTPLFTVG